MADATPPPEPMTATEADIFVRILASIEASNRTQVELASLLQKQEEAHQKYQLEAMKALASPVPPAPG